MPTKKVFNKKVLALFLLELEIFIERATQQLDILNISPVPEEARRVLEAYVNIWKEELRHLRTLKTE